MTIPQFGYAGHVGASDDLHTYGAMTRLVTQMLNRIQTCTLVRVVAVTNKGELAAAGLIDVQPLVNQLDGHGNAIPHGVLHQLIYLRLQGGTDAVIMDPKVGDIGMAGFASRDISAVKATRRQANPGSWRSYDMADGMYFGGMLNATPVQYIQFQDTGIRVVSPAKVTVEAPDVFVNAQTVTVQCDTSTVTASASAAITAPAISLGASGQSLRKFITSEFQALFNSHTHTGNGPGAQTAPPTQQLTNTHMTDVVNGG